MSFTITIKKEVSVRQCRITEQPNGYVHLHATFDGIQYLDCELELAGSGPRILRASPTRRLSPLVEGLGAIGSPMNAPCTDGGTRLTPQECDLARKELARLERQKGPQCKARIAKRNEAGGRDPRCRREAHVQRGQPEV